MWTFTDETTGDTKPLIFLGFSKIERLIIGIMDSRAGFCLRCETLPYHAGNTFSVARDARDRLILAHRERQLEAQRESILKADKPTNSPSESLFSQSRYPDIAGYSTGENPTSGTLKTKELQDRNYSFGLGQNLLSAYQSLIRPTCPTFFLMYTFGSKRKPLHINDLSENLRPFRVYIRGTTNSPEQETLWIT